MIELKNVERSYKTGPIETWVLRRIGITIKEGEFLTVMGPSAQPLRRVCRPMNSGWAHVNRRGIGQGSVAHAGSGRVRGVLEKTPSPTS